MSMEPTQYPAPIFPGGLITAAGWNPRAWRTGPSLGMKQPFLGNAPVVSSITGFGTGSGAYIRNNGSDADASQGIVEIIVGINPSASGTVVLQFPVATPAAAGGIFCAAYWATLVVTQGQTLTINWTGNADLLPNTRRHIAYQWVNSF